MAVLGGSCGEAIGFLHYLRLIICNRRWKTEFVRVARLAEQSSSYVTVDTSVVLQVSSIQFSDFKPPGSNRVWESRQMTVLDLWYSKLAGSQLGGYRIVVAQDWRWS